MHYEHEGMSLWFEPNERLATGKFDQGENVNLTVGVEPADASNLVQVLYRVNGGPATKIPATSVRHVGNAQYFNAQLPCAALCEGDTVEYAAVCHCAGRQVPSQGEAETFASSFRVIKASVSSDVGANQPSVSPMMLRQTSAPTAVNPRSKTEEKPTASLKPTHLCLFAVQRDTGHPIARMPFYAEVGVTSEIRNPPVIDHRFEQPTIAVLSPPVGLAIMEMESAITRYARLAQLPQSLLELLSSWLDQETRDRLADNPEMTTQIITEILQRLGELGQGKENFNPDDPEAVRQLLEEAFRAYLKDHPELSLAPTRTIQWAHPLGILATDHVGYLSYDLTRLPSDVYGAVIAALHARQLDPTATTNTSIWLYAMAREETRFDALAQGRFARDAIVVKLELDVPHLPEEFRNLGMLAMQNPNLIDWQLSPASFAANPTALLGEDGCENLFPAHVALQEFYFYQVISLSDVIPDEIKDVKDKVKMGIVNEYRLAWYPLGHSLGQIQYTLPLAPGESVNLAVIDWTRKDIGERSEFTKETEQLIHNQQRDRTITETVQAAIKEHQSGSSFMWGTAASAGAAGTVGAFGVAAGLTGSLGGSSSDSDGSRDIAGSTVQKLSDNISQASAAMRELQSTVVVQTTSQEKEAIETRTVVNYNHSHALTILYYEVLRHFRVVTEFVRRRPVVLVKLDADVLAERSLVKPPKPLVIHSNDPVTVTKSVTEFTQQLVLYYQTVQNLLENRPALEAALLDKRHTEGFNALQRISHRRQVDAATPPLPSPLQPLDLNEEEFVFFELQLRTGGMSHDGTELNGFLLKDARNVLTNLINTTDAAGKDAKKFPANRLEQHGSFGANDHTYLFYAIPESPDKVKWRDLFAIGLRFTTHGTDAGVSIAKVIIEGRTLQGGKYSLIDWSGDEIYYGAANLVLVVNRPPAPEIPPPPPPRPADEIEDDAKVAELIDHLAYNNAHYSRALYLNQNPAERARQLDAIKLGGNSTVLEKIENRPLEMVGDFIAYPCSDANWAIQIENAIRNSPHPEPVPDERLVTLPTRGLFAEAKLGHCNASEIIKDNRFWKWEEHAIPHLAPEIAAIQAGQHQVKDLNLQSTPFPQSMVNIVNPSAAPDPSGLAAAMNILGTPNIFRDMSGRAEVSDLLKKLSDNSISIAEAANRAKEIQNKYGVDLDKQQKDYDLGQYQAETELLGKAIEAESKRIAEAKARKEEADATKAEAEAGKAQAQAATNMPKPADEQLKQAAANTALGNPKKTKTVVFKAFTFDGQLFEGVFHLTVTDTNTAKSVLDRTTSSQGMEQVTFSSSEPTLTVTVKRDASNLPFKAFGEVISIPEINTSSKESYRVGKNHGTIDIFLIQEPRPVKFSAKSTEEATEKLVSGSQGEVGIDKGIAANMVLKYEKEKNIKHTGETSIEYSFEIPSKNYRIDIKSK